MPTRTLRGMRNRGERGSRDVGLLQDEKVNAFLLGPLQKVGAMAVPGRDVLSPYPEGRRAASGCPEPVREEGQSPLTWP